MKLGFTTKPFNSCRVPKKLVVDYIQSYRVLYMKLHIHILCTVTTFIVVIFYIHLFKYPGTRTVNYK